MEDLFIIDQLLAFILVMYTQSSITRMAVQIIVEKFISFLIYIFLSSIKKDILYLLKESFKEHNEKMEYLNDKQKLKKLTDHLFETLHDGIVKCFNDHSNILSSVETEYKRFQLLRSKGLIAYQEFIIGNEIQEVYVNDDLALNSKLLYGVAVPLRETLKLFLEIPGIFKATIDYMNRLKNNCNFVENIIQTDFWNKTYARSDKLILPLYLYFDDFEGGNALGSHAGKKKFGCMYVSIACLPPHIASRLTSILFANIIYSEDKQNCSNKNMFSKIIEEFNFLKHEGICINLNGKAIKVYFQCVLILGDNLGLNQILGFVESFKANYFCRICRVHRDVAAKMIEEDNNLLRNVENYDADVAINSVTDTGINESCAFHLIDGFHVTKNLLLDIMHDMSEGVCVYVMRAIIYNFIYEKKYFTLGTLNSRIQSFDFGKHEKSNRPPVISFNNEKNKFNLKMSSSEMICLVRYFGLIIGDLVPEGDKYWSMYICLRQIMVIIMSPKIIRQDIVRLETLISTLNRLYVTFVGKLKPKFHNMVHYPRLLLANGPLVHFWSMRNESKHAELRATVKNINTNKNVLKTLAIKQMLIMCEMMHSLKLAKTIRLGSKETQKKKLEEIKLDPRIFFPNINDPDLIESFNNVEIKGTLYTKGTILVSEITERGKIFGDILKIFKIKDDIFFFLRTYEEVTYSKHYQAYIVQLNQEKNIIKNVKDLLETPPCLLIEKKNISFIATRY